MKKAMMAAIVSLVMTGTAAAAGYGLEEARMESGRRFDEQQSASGLNPVPLVVQVTGAFQRGAEAKYNAEARDYTRFEIKAPPVPEAVKEEKAETPAAAPESGWVAPEKGKALLNVALTLLLAAAAFSLPVFVLLAVCISAAALGLAAAPGTVVGHGAGAPAEQAE
ncbi:MAG: hypothetical protein A2X31_03795 [Elusimicrobia bacterium GWB2_63_22]|nr:MAG: hypothetical protein A2X31_03795 [Elusimicrobia bacterium GWB2_63_22]